MNKIFIKKEMNNYLFLTIGSSILALGLILFFIPNELITGGSAGLSLLLHYLTSYSVSILMVLINIPLLILGYKYLGKLFAIRTIITIILISVFVEFFIEVLKIRAFTLDLSLSSIFGGIFIGIGLALVIKGNSSAGGSTIIARIISSNSEIKPGTVILGIDTIIISSALFIYTDKTNVLWSIISIYITSKIIDTILTGSLNKKVVYLVTKKIDLFSELILKELGPDGTILEGKGLNKDENKKMILIVVEVSKLQILRELIKENDANAFLIISEANEMIGRGH